MAEINLDELDAVSGGGACTKRYIRYTILQGDTLEAIAAKYGTTEEELIEINRIRNKRRLAPGQKLMIPVK